MRILIVEDDRITLTLYERTLSEYGEVTTAVNGREGYECYCKAQEENCPFDLIFMDIMMPEVDGLSAVAAIRALEKDNEIPASQGVPIVILTALEDTLCIYQAECEEVLDYIIKPVSRNDIINCIQKYGTFSEAESEV